jgi:hypothetical protein
VDSLRPAFAGKGHGELFLRTAVQPARRKSPSLDVFHQNAVGVHSSTPGTRLLWSRRQLLLRLVVAAADRGIVSIDAGGDVSVMVAVEVIAISGEGRIKHPLHPAVLKQHMVHSRRMMEGMQAVVGRGICHDRVVAAATISDRLQLAGGITVPKRVAKVAPHLSNQRFQPVGADSCLKFFHTWNAKRAALRERAPWHEKRAIVSPQPMFGDKGRGIQASPRERTCRRRCWILAMAVSVAMQCSRQHAELPFDPSGPRILDRLQQQWSQ